MVEGKKARSKPEGYAGDSMSFYINTEQIGDVAVLQCTGRMVRGPGLSLLKDAVTRLSQLRVVVLDLSELEMVDAGGLGVLVSLQNWACAKGIQLKLVNPSKLVRQMLEVTRLTSVLHISSVEDLIQIFCNSHRAIENVDRAVA
jgi:anti-anti-sigma factor